MVDATCGNGHDSKWLAEAVGPAGMLYAFDIQVPVLLRRQCMLLPSILPVMAYHPAPNRTLACHYTVLCTLNVFDAIFQGMQMQTRVPIIDMQLCNLPA